MKTAVLSLGGSIIAPDKPNSVFLSSFVKSISSYLSENPEDRLILVCGGGAPARDYQKAFRDTVSETGCADPSVQDWIGIKATHLNAQLVKAVLGDLCKDEVVTDPTSESVSFTGRILVAGGWKPGFSTDTDAVYLARRFGGKKVVNLSNIAKVYTDDPRKNPDAKPIDTISWVEFRKMVGDEWVPGKNTPFDPIASAMAQESEITVICADGRNVENTIAILTDAPFEGTVIG